MRQTRPTTHQIKQYFNKYNPRNLAGATVELVNAHNHLIYRAQKNGKVYCLRMINPESWRAGQWLSAAEEYTILKYLENSGLGPNAYFVDPERFVIPLMIQEFIDDAVCYKNLKPLSEKYLIAAAQAIALLNSQNITPENFPFREGYTRYSYLTSIKTWQRRLEEIKAAGRKDLLEWTEKIRKVTQKAKRILEKFEPRLAKAPFCFNFDGAHCGNTYWKNDKVIFLDWQKVSYGDPAFTLARFLTSVSETGEVASADKNLMIAAYLEKCGAPDFARLVDQRLFERQTADLIWVLWQYVKEGKAEAAEKETTVATRLRRVEELLKEYA